jgi:hypothetical protein
MSALASRYHLRHGVNSQSNDLAGNVLPAGLLVVHDTSRGGEDNVTELTRRKELDNPLLNLVELDVVAGRDTSALVDTTVELDDDLFDVSSCSLSLIQT